VRGIISYNGDPASAVGTSRRSDAGFSRMCQISFTPIYRVKERKKCKREKEREREREREREKRRIKI